MLLLRTRWHLYLRCPGDVNPVNRAEFIVVTFTMFGGGFLWAWIIGAVCAITSTLDIKKIEYQQMVGCVPDSGGRIALMTSLPACLATFSSIR